MVKFLIIVESPNKIKKIKSILGSDYDDGRFFTGWELNIPLYFHKRDHDYSTTNLREKIIETKNNN